jgi:hypothetical protein
MPSRALRAARFVSCSAQNGKNLEPQFFFLRFCRGICIPAPARCAPERFFAQRAREDGGMHW